MLSDWRNLLVTLALVASGAIATGVEIGIAVEPAGRAVAEGESALVKVRVSSASRVGAPELVSEPQGPTIRAGGTSSQFSFGIGARTRHDVVHQFEVAGKPGTYRLKAIVADASGSKFESESVTVMFRERTAAEKAREPELRIRLPKTTAFAGEVLPAELLVLQKAGTNFRLERGNLPSIEGAGLNVQLTDDPRVGPQVDGFESIVFPAEVTPLKAGQLSLQASFEPLFVVRSSTGRMRNRRFSLGAEPTEIEVRPLPAEGRPSGFAGAVGAFKLTIAADPMKVSVGEPIAVRLGVSGIGNFDQLAAPEATTKDGWRFYKASPLEVQQGSSGRPDRQEFAQNIVPLELQSEIPSFKLVVFNPNAAKYETLITAPIPIEVTGVPRSTPPAAVATPAPADGSSGSPAVVEAPVAELTDILQAASTTPAWASLNPPVWRRVSFWWLQLTLVALLLGAAAIARSCQRRTGRKVAPPSFRELLAQVEHAPNEAATFYAAARACVEAWEKGGGELPETPEAADFAEINARHDYLHFAGHEDANKEPLSAGERSKVISLLKSLPV